MLGQPKQIGGKKQKAGRDRVEISIHLREAGCVLSTEARLVEGMRGYEKGTEGKEIGRKEKWTEEERDVVEWWDEMGRVYGRDGRSGTRVECGSFSIFSRWQTRSI